LSVIIQTDKEAYDELQMRMLHILGAFVLVTEPGGMHASHKRQGCEPIAAADGHVSGSQVSRPLDIVRK